MAIFLVYNERAISEKGVYMDRRNFLKTSLMGLVPAAVASPASALAAPAATPAPQKGMGSFKTSAKYPMVDSHLHYVDFLQQTDGLKKLTDAIDSCGVARSVLFGMPMVKMWDASAPQKPSYYMSNEF